MLALNIPGALGIAAATLTLVLLGKVSVQLSKDRIGKYLLLALLLGLLSMACNSLYFFLGMHLLWPHLSFLPLGLMACIAPSLYFYVQRVTGERELPKQRWLLHWLPGLFIEVLLLPYFLASAETKLAFINSTNGRLLFLCLYFFIYMQILVYIYLVQPCLRAFKASYLDAADHSARIDLNWITTLCYGFVAFILVDGILPQTPLAIPSVIYVVSMSLYFFIICVMAYALGQNRVYPLTDGHQEKESTKYLNSGLRSDTTDYYVNKLIKLMQEEEPYLDSELSLQKLAALLKVHPHHLSQTLNNAINKNYYDFINEYRITHAQRLLLAQPDMPIVDVAIASGYNNKNSFYNSFRRYVGKTPSDFRQNPSPLLVSDTLQG